MDINANFKNNLINLQLCFNYKWTMENERELVKKAEEISKGLKRLSKKSRKVVLPYHSSYDLIDELEDIADSLVEDLKTKE